MLKNYFLIALRQLWKNKLYSFINATGLVAGITCFLLIALYVGHETSFDNFHEKKGRIYRITLGRLSENRPLTSVSGGVMPHTLREAYTGIEDVVRFRHLPSLVSRGDKSIFEEGFMFSDSSLFSVFSFPLLEGDPKTVLHDPFSIVLSESAATRYFGKSDEVIGQTLQVDEVMSFKVTGIMKDLPGNSHIHFDMVASASTLPSHVQEPVRTYQLTGWFAHYFHNYILLDQNADPAIVAASIKEAAKIHSDPEQYKLYGTNMALFLQPLNDIHLNPMYGELEPQGDRKILMILSGVGALILILACVNFANISTALSFNRRKEVGMRKTLGARKKQLVWQFLGEAGLICFITFVVSIALLQLLLPAFNSLAGKQIIWMEIFNARNISIIAAALVVTSVAGGIYPALMLGRLAPVSILRGKLLGGISGFGFRKAVVVFQFTASMVLIACSLVIFRQINHMLTKDLGLSTENVIVIPTHGDPSINGRRDPFFERLEIVPGVASATICELIPGETIYGIIAKFEGKENINFRTMSVGYNYLETFGMTLAAGRAFSRDQPLDTAVDRILINEAMARYQGWTAEEAVGKVYDRGGDGQRIGEVIGVVKDFNFTSLKNEIGPLVISCAPNFFDKIAIRIDGTADKETIAQIKEVWSGLFPTRPFDFRYADEAVHRQYQAEQKFGSLFAVFSSLSIAIGVLGLFGMVSLDLNSKVKEIGIRKVLGANVASLIKLLSRDSMKLVVISIAVSLPLSFWLSKMWLEGFNYRLQSIEWLLILPATAVGLLALAIVCFQTMKTAARNPVDSLRNE